MMAMDLRILLLAFLASTSPVFGQDHNGSCAVPRTGSVDLCADAVRVVLQVSSLNETVLAVPVQATRQMVDIAPRKPAAITTKRPDAISTKVKFQLEHSHFQRQMEAARKMRQQFSTPSPHFERDIEYYDKVLDEYDDYLLRQKETKVDYCKDDGRVTTGDKYLVQQDAGILANDYEVFHGVGVYRFHTKPKTWKEARRQCESEGAHLLVLNSQEEANVTMIMFSRCRNLDDQQLNDFAYVGVRQKVANGDYLTIQGEKVNRTGYANWEFGHPDTTTAKSEKCVSINRAGYLVDLDCHHRLAYFCEYEGF